MKPTHMVLILALAAACGRGELPTGTFPPVTTDSPKAQANAAVAGFVIDEFDQCIIGARVEVVDGPRAGATFVQTVCGFWDYGDDLGYSFLDLPAGVSVTLRATAKGYISAEKHAVPTNPYQYTTMIVLAKE